MGGGPSAAESYAQGHAAALKEQNGQMMADFSILKDQNERMTAEFSNMKEVLAKTKEDLAKAEASPYDPAHPDKLVKVQTKLFNTFLASAANDADLQKIPKSVKFSLAVLGQSGVGKSTIINSYVGKDVAEVGKVETTQNITIVEGNAEYDFYDVPGSHDDRADFYHLDKLQKLKTLHVILVVYENRIQLVLNILRLLTALNIPLIAVRNKCAFEHLDDPRKFSTPAEEWEATKELELAHLHAIEPGASLVYLGIRVGGTMVPPNMEELTRTIEVMRGTGRSTSP